jgi:hypothetical protein
VRWLGKVRSVVTSGYQLFKLPLVVHRTTARRQLGRDIAIANISVRMTSSNPTLPKGGRGGVLINGSTIMIDFTMELHPGKIPSQFG